MRFIEIVCDFCSNRAGPAAVGNVFEQEMILKGWTTLPDGIETRDRCPSCTWARDGEELPAPDAWIEGLR